MRHRGSNIVHSGELGIDMSIWICYYYLTHLYRDYEMYANISVKCRGRNSKRNVVMHTSVDASVFVRELGGSSGVSLEVDCVHAVTAGGHGERNCGASGEDGVTCPFAVDIPYAIDEAKSR